MKPFSPLVYKRGCHEAVFHHAGIWAGMRPSVLFLPCLAWYLLLGNGVSHRLCCGNLAPSVLVFPSLWDTGWHPWLVLCSL